MTKLMDPFREWLSSWLDAIAAYIRPYHRPLWHGEDPLPKDALWLKCGHPSTDGSDEWMPLTLHGTVDTKITLPAEVPITHFLRQGSSYEKAWCWWHGRWEELA